MWREWATIHWQPHSNFLAGKIHRSANVSDTDKRLLFCLCGIMFQKRLDVSNLKEHCHTIVASI